VQVKTNHTNLHIFVDGRVQGVGYRRFVHEIANKLGLKGWVRNLLDGRVEIKVSISGQSFNEVKDQFVAELNKGPIFAKVRSISVAEITEEFASGFIIQSDEELATVAAGSTKRT
jgi:acylphosphatase